MSEPSSPRYLATSWRSEVGIWKGQIAHQPNFQINLLCHCHLRRVTCQHIFLIGDVTFHLQEYHKEIDSLKAELQAARDKDGVFLPHETYQEQIKENARKEEEIKGITKELKAKEQELERFMVR